MREIIIAQYRGKSMLSKLIEWQTRSDWSHSAIIFQKDDGMYWLVEAWHRGGVSCCSGDTIEEVLSANHTPGTKVDLFTINVTPTQWLIARRAAFEEVGKPYDFALILKFLSRRPAKENGKWICSELVCHSLAEAGIMLQHLPCWAMSPELVGISPLLKRETIITTR